MESDRVAATMRPWWDVRAAVIVWRRVGGYDKDSRISWPWPKWHPKRIYWTTRHWWMHGHGRHLAS